MQGATESGSLFQAAGLSSAATRANRSGRSRLITTLRSESVWRIRFVEFRKLTWLKRNNSATQGVSAGRSPAERSSGQRRALEFSDLTQQLALRSNCYSRECIRTTMHLSSE